MRPLAGSGFTDAGQAQSRQFAWQPCILCGAPIRVSWFLLIAFAYQLSAAFLGSEVFNEDLFVLICGQEAILIMTVLCHEFGHGLMARRLGGEIDHILLWPFGGICFSSRPPNVTDPKKVLRNELQVVAAGPSTHFLMTPFWAGLLYVLTELTMAQCQGVCVECVDGWGCIVEWARPFGGRAGIYSTSEGPLMGHFASLLWRLLGEGVRLNVMLFLFNVFFPMYPADGSKLLVVGLMYCGGVPADTAALILICCTTVCAIIFIMFCMHQVMALRAFQQGAMMTGLAGFMGVMSLVEAYRLWQLRERRQLHTHPLFQTARSWSRRSHEGGVAVNRINLSELDDEPDEVLQRSRKGCDCCCCCPWQSWRHEAVPQHDEDEEDVYPREGLDDQTQAQNAETRQHREQFLRSLEQQQPRR